MVLLFGTFLFVHCKTYFNDYGKKIEHLESASRFAEYKIKMNAYPIYKRTSKSEKVLIQTIKNHPIWYDYPFVCSWQLESTESVAFLPLICQQRLNKKFKSSNSICLKMPVINNLCWAKRDNSKLHDDQSDNPRPFPSTREKPSDVPIVWRLHWPLLCNIICVTLIRPARAVLSFLGQL